MALPLPYTLDDEVGEGIQGNFDAIKKEFPLSRRHMKIEAPNDVGAAGQPAFQGAWVNFDVATYRGARFWKDPMGLVHVEGRVKDGAAGSTIFILPAGYRPALGLRYAVDTDTGHGTVDVAPTGNVVHVNGGAASVEINFSFKQEQ